MSLMILTAQAYTENISKQCELAITKATKIHWKYVCGETSRKKTIIATKEMKTKCKKG